jgi:hypothetical protein
MSCYVTVSKEEDVWLVPTRQLTNLSGEPEYLGVIRDYVRGTESRRLITLVTSMTSDKMWWVDTTTGTIYNTETGQGYNSRILQLPPEKTGRKVPDSRTRLQEAEIRYLNSQRDDDGTENTETCS